MEERLPEMDQGERAAADMADEAASLRQDGREAQPQAPRVTQPDPPSEDELMEELKGVEEDNEAALAAIALRLKHARKA